MGMIKASVVVVLAIAMTACAHVPPAPFIVFGSEASVSVKWENSTLGSYGALEAAQKHCARYGREAELATQVSRSEAIYRCVVQASEDQ